MAITQPDIKLFKSSEVSDVSTNGGRVDRSNQVSDGSLENVFSNADSAERTAGSIKYRKVTYLVDSANADTALNAKAWLHAPTPSDDFVAIFEGTPRDTQASMVQTRRYPVGSLVTSVSAGATVIVVEFEDSTLLPFIADGYDLVISDKANPTDVSGNREFKAVSGTPSTSGNQLTITLDSALANAYSSTDTYVAAVIDFGNIVANYDNFVVTSSAGLYDDTTYPPELMNDEVEEQTITITFSDAVNFTVVGDTVGSLGSGSTGADFIHDLFTLRAAGFSGTFVGGDTIVFQTHVCGVDIWERRDIPAGCDPLSNNSYYLAFLCEG